MFKTIKRIHFVGIGGSGMSGIAEVLLKLGYQVSGSDLHKNVDAERLEKNGAIVFEGHRAFQIEGADVVVTSTAVSPSNPEVKAAHQKNIPVIPRIEMLAEIARLKYTIAIAGTHGKTTTTSLVGQILKSADMDPTVIVGGRLKAVGTGGVLGSGDYLVAEADESDGSFLKLSPTISVVTNIDNDHMDFYKTEENLLEAFRQFSDRVPFYGITYLCGDDPGVKKVLPHLRRRFATYGFSKSSDLKASNIRLNDRGSIFTVVDADHQLGDIHLPLAGRHNVLNALAATAVALKLGIPFAKIAQGLLQFEGVGRRIELKGIAQEITVLDDYGHHPTEIKATLEAVKSRWSKGRLFVLFQPHRFSRTKALHREFAKVLSKNLDQLYLLPVYPAGEKPIKGVSSELISKRIPKNNWKPWRDEGPKGNSFDEIVESLKPGDVVLTLGAGDVWKRGEEILKRLTSPVYSLAKAVPSLAKRISMNHPLARHSTWAIGGPADLYVEVQTAQELELLVKFCREHTVPLTVLGWGSNVLVPDEGLSGCVVRLKGEFEAIKFDGQVAQVGAGVHLPKLAKACAEKGLSGVEALAGVPGTVGGALISNAGTPRGVIGDVVESVQVMEESGASRILSRSELAFEYRQSNLAGKFILGATLVLKEGNREDLLGKVKEELVHRQNTQPLGTKNTGSVFRNPPNQFAGRLIEVVGLKGKRNGNVRFSPKHANFIENMGGGTAKETLELIRQAQSLVKEKFNIDLIPEVKILSPLPWFNNK